MWLKLLIAGFLSVVSVLSYSQTRLSLSAYLGLGDSWFSGNGASAETAYHTDYLPDQASYANHPYGKNTTLVGQAGLQIKLERKEKWSAALNLHYGNAGGENKITSVVSSSGTQPANGEHKRVYEFISVNPTFGKLITGKNLAFTFQMGIDYAFALTFSEDFKIEDLNGKTFLYGYSGGVPKSNDFRLTLGTNASIGRWGLDICYKRGLRNYSNDEGAKVFSNLVECKVMYKILAWKGK